MYLRRVSQVLTARIIGQMHLTSETNQFRRGVGVTGANPVAVLVVRRGNVQTERPFPSSLPPFPAVGCVLRERGTYRPRAAGGRVGVTTERLRAEQGCGEVAGARERGRGREGGRESLFSGSGAASCSVNWGSSCPCSLLFWLPSRLEPSG